MEYKKVFIERIILEHLVELRWVNLSTMVAVIEGIIVEYLESRRKQVQWTLRAPEFLG